MSITVFKREESHSIKETMVQSIPEVSLKETSSDMSLDAIETTCVENLKQIEKKCATLRSQIEDKWKRVAEIREAFNMELMQIQEVETIIEHKLEALAGDKQNPNAMLPAAIESNIKALHIKTKRAKHSVKILSQILDEGMNAIDLPMVATHPGDTLGLEADRLLAEIDNLQRELERTEASCAI